ncbi:High mobility group protein 1 [Pleurostoma richardsiae]|uniref:High mobility group protein 1 n=1 Tax=Pleurostoma richardsiae TaxID=41990 RepID=A0AA38VXU3_9PEZI|nr:High mobility group protein 1 [Pleurostoma richardsiae]
MARPPKNKAPEEKPPVASSSVMPPRVIDVDNFIRVRDSVYSRLATIQDLIKSFSADYLRQTNLLLGEGTNLENGGELPDLESALGLNLLPPVPGPPAPPVEEKKERKKRHHDPNAPKRPLTPYFLYMQTARPIIAGDLGEAAPKGAVQEEGQRRWASMTPSEKQGWNKAYQYNLRLYNARVHSFKAGNENAKNMTDQEALKYAEEFQIPVPAMSGGDPEAGNDQDAIAEQLQQSAAAEEPAAEETPAAKTPRSKAGTRKRKTATPGGEQPEPAKSAAATPASPEKKRKRTSTKPAAAEPEKEEPKKSGRKKTKSG